MNLSKAISIRIKELLKEKNITQYKLGKEACIPYETIKSIMKEKSKGINLKTVILVADGFDMTVSEFLNSPLFNYENLNLDWLFYKNLTKISFASFKYR